MNNTSKQVGCTPMELTTWIAVLLESSAKMVLILEFPSICDTLEEFTLASLYVFSM